MKQPFSRRKLLRGAVGFAAAAALPTRALAGSAAGGSADGAGLPLSPRPFGAIGGRAFAEQVAGLSDSARYAASVEQILAGNAPDFLRQLTPVSLAGPPGYAGPRAVTVFVTPDYLSVGSREDFVRVPLDMPAARRLAGALDATLPTPHLVDAIYAAAGTQLPPAPLPPTAQMRTMGYALQHQALIEAERGGRSITPLIAGHKKDLVLTGRLHQQGDRVAIYGWHRLTGEPIQPLSLVHGAGYADYSHGLRLVSRTALVDGEPAELLSLLADPTIAPLLTREGLLAGAEALLRAG